MHPRSDVDRLYVERDKGVRGLISVEETVLYEAHSLKKYTETSNVELIKSGGKLIKSDSEDDKRTYRAHQKKDRLDKWCDKPMNGQHVRQTREHAAPESWLWMKRGSLKRETESLIVAAQDHTEINPTRDSSDIEKSSDVVWYIVKSLWF